MKQVAELIAAIVPAMNALMNDLMPMGDGMYFWDSALEDVLDNKGEFKTNFEGVMEFINDGIIKVIQDKIKYVKDGRVYRS